MASLSFNAVNSSDNHSGYPKCDKGCGKSAGSRSMEKFCLKCKVPYCKDGPNRGAECEKHESHLSADINLEMYRVRTDIQDRKKIIEKYEDTRKKAMDQSIDRNRKAAEIDKLCEEKIHCALRLVMEKVMEDLRNNDLKYKLVEPLKEFVKKCNEHQEKCMVDHKEAAQFLRDCKKVEQIVQENVVTKDQECVKLYDDNVVKNYDSIKVVKQKEVEETIADSQNTYDKCKAEIDQLDFVKIIGGHLSTFINEQVKAQLKSQFPPGRPTILT